MKKEFDDELALEIKNSELTIGKEKDENKEQKK